MPEREFGPNDLDEFGCPAWIAELGWDENRDPNHLVHVVRDLEPADALKLLGADRTSIRPVVLPPERPDGKTLPRAAIAPLAPTAVLIAGQINGWTFVYDDLGYTLASFHLPQRPPPSGAATLSAEGRTAATSNVTINGQPGFTYAVDGTEVVWLEWHDMVEPDQDLPAEVRSVLEAAGTFGVGYDLDRCMRMICILAGLPWTLDDLRAIPLLGAAVN